VQGNSGVPFMDLRRKQLMRARILCLEETAVTALLRRQDGSAGGVFGLNYITGEYIVVLARAVILATGYSDRLHARSTGTREMSGDGIAMAWRVGATLANLEMQWWHTNDIAYPPTWQRMQVYPNPMLGSEKSARMINSEGQEFFNQQQDDPLAYGPYTVQLKALAKEVHAGRARYDGGYFAGFDHCDATEVDAYTTYGKGFRQLGLRFPQDLVETAVTAHYRQGGIDVDTETMCSSVPGLYVAGGLGGHSNGLIGLATYDGKVVAEGVLGALARLALAKEVQAGRARYDGGYFAGFDHCDATEVDAYTTYGKGFRQLGLRFPQDLVETAVTAHYRQGGIDVDTETMCSSVPGLYVAGGLGGHSNGLIGLATYDGKVVAESVLGALPRLAPCELPESQVESERLRLEALLSRGSDGITPAKVKEKVRSVMWEKVGVEKDAGSLRSALADIEDFRLDLLPRMGVKRTARDVNYEWLDAIDAVNMIDACELIIHSSLERKESRGPFMRRDFPNTDNAHWLAANVMKKTENGFRFEQRPYELPFFQPSFVEKNNLEVAW
jgi:succinate dehydrogenase/fumarate reductase flavoprotein subunit